MSNIYKEHCVELLSKGVFEFGEFKLTYGPIAKVYVDYYKVLGFPDIQSKLVTSLLKLIDDNNVQFDCICGTAYAGLPYAGQLSYELRKPLVTRLKEKQLDAKHIVHPVGTTGSNRCLVVEEVIASGRTVLEVIKDLENTGYIVVGVLALMDRSQNGVQNLRSLNYNVYPLFYFMDIVRMLYDDGVLSKEKYEICAEDCSYKLNINGGMMNSSSLTKRKRITYRDRGNACKNTAAARLFDLMLTKETNLAINIISPNVQYIVEALEIIGSEICLLCINSDILENLNEELMKKLQHSCNRHNVMLLDDKKITSATELAMLRDNYVFDCADFITVYALSGFEKIGVAANSLISCKPDKGIFVVTDFSDNSRILSKPYVDEAIQFAELHAEYVAGVVSLSNRVISTELVHIMPNLFNFNLDSIIQDCGSDVSLVVEYDEYFQTDKLKKARRIAWDSYIRRLSDVVD